MAEKRPMSRHELESRIVALAWKDDGFRKKFLANPKAEFEARTGTKLPAELKITAYAEDADHLHFVVPAKPKGIAELSDADLEKVAGGVDIISSVALTVAVTVTTAMSVDVTIKETEGRDKGWNP